MKKKYYKKTESSKKSTPKLYYIIYNPLTFAWAYLIVHEAVADKDGGALQGVEGGEGVGGGHGAAVEEQRPHEPSQPQQHRQHRTATQPQPGRGAGGRVNGWSFVSFCFFVSFFHSFVSMRLFLVCTVWIKYDMWTICNNDF